jgi:hypothetical protein
MLFTDMLPAFIGQINFMTQLILDRSKHRTRLPRIFAIASRIIDVGLIAGQGSSRKAQVPKEPFYLLDAKLSPKLIREQQNQRPNLFHASLFNPRPPKDRGF